MQKGYSTAGGGQYKLQVDGVSGKPTCVMSDQGQATIHVARGRARRSPTARGTASSAGGSAPACRIHVDDQEAGSATLPAGLSVANAQPLSLGGKGTGVDNDQFHGSIDDVWVGIG